MFEDGEAPPRPEQEPPEALTVGIDATGIRLQDGTLHSVKLAVAFTSSEQLTASKRRRRSTMTEAMADAASSSRR